MTMAKFDTFILKIYRGSPGHQYWEEFEIPLYPDANVISALMDIQKNPVNRQGHQVTPIAWEAGCLEEVCGSCSMLINSFPRQACTALIEPILNKTGTNIIILAPFTKFPLIRDLVIDRSIMFENLKKIHGWISVDGSYTSRPGLPISPHKQEVRYSLSTCMTCGCCIEACPQINSHSKFMGPQIMAQVQLFNSHPIGKIEARTRLHAVMGEGGLEDCGNAQNCSRVCPRNIPLVEAIAAIGRDITLQAFKDLFSYPDRDEP
jgi:succinate dehydrogenase / fumarate reductase iron-sulfur subunit